MDHREVRAALNPNSESFGTDDASQVAPVAKRPFGDGTTAPVGRSLAIMEPETHVTSRNIDKKRLNANDEEIPAELGQREAQDRAKASSGSGGAQSPVDSMHVDAPKQQDNARGHERDRQSRQ